MRVRRGTRNLIAFRRGETWVWCGPDDDGRIPRRLLSEEQDGTVVRVVILEAIERDVAKRLSGPVLRILSPTGSGR